MRNVSEQQLQHKNIQHAKSFRNVFILDKAMPEINKYILKTPWLIF